MYGQGLMSETAVVWPRSDVRDGGCMAKVCCQRQRLYGQGLLSETAAYVLLNRCPEGRNWFSSRPVNHGGYDQRDATRLRQVLLVLQDCCRRREEPWVDRRHRPEGGGMQKPGAVPVAGPRPAGTPVPAAVEALSRLFCRNELLCKCVLVC